MDIVQAVILALIQGLTEFLPVSSSAHLILLPIFTDWPDQGLAFDVALNSATWLAVVLYFRKELTGLLRGLVCMVQKRGADSNQQGRLALMVLGASVPVGIAGLLGHDIVEGYLRTIGVIAFSSIVWGLVLWAADRRPGGGGLESINWPKALFVGFAQALALVPGTSRSGITITAGLFAGLSRPAAARFSFLLSVIVGAMAGGLEGLKMLRDAGHTPWAAVSVGFVVAFITAYLTIHYFLKFISRASMAPFVVYRVLLGVLLILASLWM